MASGKMSDLPKLNPSSDASLTKAPETFKRSISLKDAAALDRARDAARAQAQPLPQAKPPSPKASPAPANETDWESFEDQELLAMFDKADQCDELIVHRKVTINRLIRMLQHVYDDSLIKGSDRLSYVLFAWEIYKNQSEYVEHPLLREQPKVLSPKPIPNEPTDEEDIGHDPHALAECLLPLVSETRFRDQISWMEIGQVFFNICNGAERGLRAWIRHTERVLGNTMADVAEETYVRMVRTPSTVKTIAWYAKLDSPAEYDTWHKLWSWTAMKKALTMTHTDVARAFYRCFWLEFLCVDPAKSVWLHFQDHCWRNSPQGIAVYEMISDQLVDRYETARVSLCRLAEIKTGERRDELERDIKACASLVTKLKLTPFKRSVLNELRGPFLVGPEFQLDFRHDLLGLPNGVLELRDDTVIFRPGRPEDMITIQTKVGYHKFDPNHPDVLACKKWFEQCFVDEDTIDYFLKSVAACLRGRNEDKIVSFWTGPGNNSKSFLEKLVKGTIGNYAIKLPVSLVTGSRVQAGGVCPELARAKGKRICVMDEPDDKEKIKSGQLKALSGGDDFYCRSLYEIGSEIAMTFRLIITCNDPPSSRPEKALIIRFHFLPFSSTWVQDAPKTEDEQFDKREFQMDNAFEYRIPMLTKAFLFMLVEAYPKWRREGLKPTRLMLDTAEDYWQRQDIYTLFQTEYIKANPVCHVPLSELYHKISAWFRDNCATRGVPDKDEIKQQFERRWGPMVGRGWKGYQLLDEQSDDLNDPISEMLEKFVKMSESLADLDPPLLHARKREKHWYPIENVYLLSEGEKKLTFTRRQLRDAVSKREDLKLKYTVFSSGTRGNNVSFLGWA